MFPMLASVHSGSPDCFVNDPRYALEPKLDGERVLLTVTNGMVGSISRKGLDNTGLLPGEIRQAFTGLDNLTITLDGELVDGVLHVFDVPEAGNPDHAWCTPRTKLHARRAMARSVVELLGVPSLQLVPQAVDPDEKRALIEHVQEHKGEGIVIKLLDSTYRARTSGDSQRRSPAWKKAKLWGSSEALVVATSMEERGTKWVPVPGRNNAVIAMLDDDGRPVIVGSVSTNGKFMPDQRAVVEVKFASVTDGNRLYQPELLRLRPDIEPYDCTLAAARSVQHHWRSS